MATRKTVKVVAQRTEICKNCDRVDFGADTTCRLRPPAVLVDASGVVTGSAWPIVPVDGWCSEFAAKLND